MAKILIAGGEGFIGSNLQKVFNNLGVDLFDVVDLKSGTDICDVDASQYEVIVLLAANLGHDMPMFQDNQRIYKWAMRQAAHIIYTSSAAVYGDSETPHVEDEPTPAPTLYGASKLLGEKLIKASHLNWTIIRLANVYGDGDGNGAIDIFKRGGNKIYGDGSDIRDYVPVKVVCNAIKAIALNPDNYNRQVYNISLNNPMTTKQAFDIFCDISKNAEYVPSRGFDVKCSMLDNSKALAAGLIDEN